jgi:hypothetical protein
LGTRQDCLDWIVYSPYFIVDNLDSESDQIFLSYGLAKTDGGDLEYTADPDSPSLLKWYESVKAI